MNVKINSTGGLSVGDATNGYKDLATKEYVDNKTFTVSWDDVSGKPNTFTPSSHNHSAGDINSGTLDIARIPTGTSNTTVSLGNHTHSDYVATTGNQSVSGIKKFNSIYVGSESISVVTGNIDEAPGFAAVMDTSTAYYTQFIDASGGYLYVYSDDCGKFYYKPANESEVILNLPKTSGTLATQQWVSGEHLSKNTTTAQIVKSDLSLSGSITMANGKGLNIGNLSEESTKGYVYIESTNNTTTLPYIDIVKGGGQEFLELTSNSLLHTSDGGSSTLTLNFPTVTANVTKTIATTDEANLIKLLNLYVDITTPTTAFEMDSSVGWYRGCIGSDGVLPTLDWSNFSMPTDSVYQCTLALRVNSSATTLTGPSDISWVSGAGLPTSSFAGHWIFISLIREGWEDCFTQAAVWRVL